MSGSDGKFAARDLSAVLALGAIGAVFAFLSPDFLGARNLSMLAIELSTTAILALGMFCVILPGHIDLSAGSGVGLIGGVAAVLITKAGWPAPLAMLAAAALALVLWNLMGRLIVAEKMPAFIITLGGLLVFKGLFWLVIRNATVPVSPAGAPNLLARLTTTYLPPALGWCLAAGAGVFLLGGWWRRASRAKAQGVPYDAESGFLKAFLGAQLCALFVAVTNGFRGVPLPAVLLAASAAVVVTAVGCSVTVGACVVGSTVGSTVAWVTGGVVGSTVAWVTGGAVGSTGAWVGGGSTGACVSAGAVAVSTTVCSGACSTGGATSTVLGTMVSVSGWAKAGAAPCGSTVNEIAVPAASTTATPR